MFTNIQSRRKFLRNGAAALGLASTSLAEKPLRCSHCFSGWLAVFMWLVYLLVNFSMNIDFHIDPMQAFVYTLFAPCFSMYLIALIKR